MKPVVADEAAIQTAVAHLLKGRLVALPTETVYGLGADALNPEAVQRIFAAKGRPADHPLIVHISDKSMLGDWATDIPETGWKLVAKFWPGPLTIVLKKHPNVPPEVTGGQNTVALRVPNHPVALKLLRAFGGGIAAPSANRFCRISPTQASHVEEELGDKVDMILDGGPCLVGLESTIIDLSGKQPTLLRPGQISKLEIEAVLQQPLVLLVDKAKIHAPGMMEVHYSPAARTLLCSFEEIESILHSEAYQENFKVGVLTFNKDLKSSANVWIIAMLDDAKAYAHDLYGCLRKLDNAGVDMILVEYPKDTEEWSAVYDRLKKAAKPYSCDLKQPINSRAEKSGILELSPVQKN